MKKGITRYAAAWAVLLVLFNIVAFAVPAFGEAAKYTPSFWVGYVFITLCFVGNLVCAFQTFKAGTMRRLFYNLPLITISYTGLIISFIVGGLCMLIPGVPAWVAVVVGAAVLAWTAISVIKAGAAADIAENVDYKVAYQTSFIKEMTAQAEQLMNQAKTPEAKAECKKVYEALRYSDPVSSPEVAEVEEQIKEKMGELSGDIGKNGVGIMEGFVELLCQLIEKRNSQLKVLK